MAGPTGRPLPVITEENEFFWTSGADGRLRLTECESCSALLHPPQPVCRYCRGHETGVRAVSGYATLIGFTVNHRFSAPGLPAPYVVAQVAVEEDTRVRLTTNLVECDPDELELGMRLEVVFEQVEDVWLPLFRPAAEQGPPAPLPSDEVEPEHMRRHVRPMATPEKFEDKVAISGIGMSEIGRFYFDGPAAVADRAGLRTRGRGRGPDPRRHRRPGHLSGRGRLRRLRRGRHHRAGGRPRHQADLVQRRRRDLRSRRLAHRRDAGRRGGTGPACAVLPYGLGGLLRRADPARPDHPGSRSQGHGLAEALRGDLGGPHPGPERPAALPPLRNLARDAGLDRAQPACERRAQPDRDLPRSDDHGRLPVGQDGHHPFGLYDCDVPCDGSVAVIVSAVDAARDLAKSPVLVEAVGTQIMERLEWEQSSLTHEPQVLGQAAHLWTRTSLRPSDVDVAQLYDGFTFNCLSWIEGLGFCGIGEAKDFLDGGKNIARDGLLPLNTHGGQLSHGRTHGLGLVHEAVTQVRGEAGARQVDGARVAVTSTGGLTPSGVILLRADT